MEKSVSFSLVAGILFLTGCGMSELEKAQAEYFCKDHGGYYETAHDLYDYVYCNNGVKKRRSKVRDIVIEDEDYFARPEKESNK